MYFAQSKCQTNRIYLPIKWTEYQIQANYGHDAKKIGMLSKYVKTLPSMKYFTVCQYDDGPLADVPNCLVFSAGGLPDNSVPIPLLSNCHPNADFDNEDRPILASFVGSIGTHPMRREMEKALSGCKDIMIQETDHNNSVEAFEAAMRMSKYALCPRGYGRTSFRMYEAMQFGCIPIYISDVHWLPFQDELDWDKFSYVVKADRMNNLAEVFAAPEWFSGSYKEKRKTLKKVLHSHFNYNATFAAIERILARENNKR